MEQEPPDLMVGDQATLKSGGPAMTVSAVDISGMGEKVQCRWFIDGDWSGSHSELFHPDELDKVDA